MKTVGLARLGRSAEVRFTPSGDAVCNLSLAVNYGPKGADGNRSTQWIDASLWGKRAEALAPFLVKGSVHCFTLDEVHIEEFEGRNGAGFKLVARIVDVELGPRMIDAPAGAGPRQSPANNAPSRSAPANEGFEDDDIPF